MSESTSAPASGEGAGASDTGPVIGPAPASQPAISVSEAARLLSAQRRKEGDAAPGESDRKPSPNEMVTAPAARPAQAPAAEPAPKPADTGLSALERALGVPGTAPEAAPADAGDAIEIDGERYTPAQLREAIGKSGDYTKKTQAIAEQQRALQAQQEALATVLPYIQPELARLQQMVEAQAQKPDIALMATDPQRYFQELHNYEAVRAEQDRLGNIHNLQAQAQQRAMAQQLATANEQLTKEFPFWANAEERQATQAQVREWATTKGGFQPNELSGLTDARALKAMMKAMMFDRMVAGNKTTAPTPRTQAPVRGVAPPPAPTERIQVAEQTFDARPNIRNAAQLLAARRGNGSMPR